MIWKFGGGGQWKYCKRFGVLMTYTVLEKLQGPCLLYHTSEESRLNKGFRYAIREIGRELAKNGDDIFFKAMWKMTCYLFLEPSVRVVLTFSFHLGELGSYPGQVLVRHGRHA